MKLEVGMYVRTKAGMISKIVSKEDVSGSLHREEIVFILDNGNRLALHSRKVVKTSHNIIDLIEVGDYVNGVLVESIYSREKDKMYFHTFETEIMIEVTKENINNILTKEQFESMSYKVGD